MPLDVCTEALVPGSVDGASYYKCGNGQYFKDVSDQFVEVDRQGSVIPNLNSTGPKPEDAAVAPPSEPAADPNFQKAPDTDSGEASSHFKKVQN